MSLVESVWSQYSGAKNGERERKEGAKTNKEERGEGFGKNTTLYSVGHRGKKAQQKTILHWPRTKERKRSLLISFSGACFSVGPDC